MAGARECCYIPPRPARPIGLIRLMYRIFKQHLLCTGLCTLLVSPVGAASAGDADSTVELCHGFGCRLETSFTLTPAEWASIAVLMNVADSREERNQLKAVLGYMEYLAGMRSPIHQDLAGNAEAGGKGQLDCIDESVNATRFLILLENRGLLRYHRVLDRAYRRSLVTQHWAAQIEEVATGRRFVYDTWFKDNGRPPILVSSERWHNLWALSRNVNLPLANLSQGRGENIAKRK